MNNNSKMDGKKYNNHYSQSNNKIDSKQSNFISNLDAKYGKMY